MRMVSRSWQNCLEGPQNCPQGRGFLSIFLPQGRNFIKSKKQDKQDIEMMKTKPDMNEITYKEEKTALILGITAIFTVWWIFKGSIFFSFLS